MPPWPTHFHPLLMTCYAALDTTLLQLCYSVHKDIEVLKGSGCISDTDIGGYSEDSDKCLSEREVSSDEGGAIRGEQRPTYDQDDIGVCRSPINSDKAPAWQSSKFQSVEASVLIAHLSHLEVWSKSVYVPFEEKKSSLSLACRLVGQLSKCNGQILDRPI